MSLLWIFLAALVFGLASGFGRAWWRDRHPMLIEVTLIEGGSEPPRALISIDRPVTREEYRCLETAVERGGKMVLSAAHWRFDGRTPLPGHQPRA